MSTGRRLGIVGNDVPRQLVLAAGFVPTRLTGSWDGSLDPRAAELLGAVDIVTVRVLTGILARTPTLGALVICNDSQAHLRLFYVLRMLAGEGLPPVRLLDLPRRDSAAARRFAAFQLEELARFLSEVSRHPLDEAALRGAADAESLVGEAVGALRQRRRSVPPAVRGATALHALHAAMSSTPEDAIAILDAARDESRPDHVRVHITGSAHPDASLYRALESADVVVVSDDHDTADLAWIGAAVPSADLAAVCEGLAALHFARDPASAVGLISERVSASLSRAVQARAEAVVSLIRPLDDAPSWDAAETASAFAGAGIPFVTHSRVDGADAEGLAAAIVSRLVDERARA